MAEPSVQVPVSQEQLDSVVAEWVANRNGNQIDLSNVADLKARLHALLSQSTPTAEPVCACVHPEFDHGHSEGDGCLHCPCKEFATSAPSIADMAPGTTFTAVLSGGKRLRTYTVTERRILTESEGGAYALGDIDPSTIRDVTPPEVTS